jgi:hypothetical protein
MSSFFPNQLTFLKEADLSRGVILNVRERDSIMAACFSLQACRSATNSLNFSLIPVSFIELREGDADREEESDFREDFLPLIMLSAETGNSEKIEEGEYTFGNSHILSSQRLQGNWVSCTQKRVLRP